MKIKKKKNDGRCMFHQRGNLFQSYKPMPNGDEQ